MRYSLFPLLVVFSSGVPGHRPPDCDSIVVHLSLPSLAGSSGRLQARARQLPRSGSDRPKFPVLGKTSAELAPKGGGMGRASRDEIERLKRDANLVKYACTKALLPGRPQPVIAPRQPDLLDSPPPGGRVVAPRRSGTELLAVLRPENARERTGHGRPVPRKARHHHRLHPGRDGAAQGGREAGVSGSL